MMIFYIILFLSINSRRFGVYAQTPPQMLMPSSTLSETIGDNNKRYIVKFKQSTTPLSPFLFSSSQSLEPPASFTKLSEGDPRVVMSLSPESATLVMTLETEEELKFWESREDVEYIEEDSRVYLHENVHEYEYRYQNQQRNLSRLDTSESTPWGIEKVKALSVSDDQISISSNQKVCIIDTGYEIDHPDLPPLPTNLGKNDDKDKEKDEGQITGKSQIKGEKWDEDGHGHGTHVAGTIAAIGNNERGVVGVSRNGELKLHIVKIFDNDGKWTWKSDLISAVESCVEAKATVINMSLGGGKYSKSENALYERVYNENGILLVASSGNAGEKEHMYPASYPAVMSVGAVGIDDDIAFFSNFNDELDIVAPGVNVLSTYTRGRYAYASGTSMSAPHVAGVAALLWSHFPEKSVQNIRQALEESAQDLGKSGRDDIFGHGLVRADSAYTFLLGGDNGNGNEVVDEVTKCFDDPIGWHDREGTHYNCEWYEREDNCKKYGESFKNQEKTANMACCACGGGSLYSGKPTNPAPSPSPSSSLPPDEEQSNVTCGCPNTCTSDVLARKIGNHGLTLLDQIMWLRDVFDYTEIEACIFMCVDLFSNLCGECDPSRCSA